MSVRPKLTTVTLLVQSAVTLTEILSVSARKDILEMDKINVWEVCIIILIKNWIIGYCNYSVLIGLAIMVYKALDHAL